MNETIIKPEELKSYYEKKYRLTTIIPLVEKPKKVVREVSQVELEDFLDGYGEVAEFIVGLEEIQKTTLGIERSAEPSIDDAFIIEPNEQE